MLIYIILRLFVPKKHIYLEGDELRYLTCANRFYALWNKWFYDTHPPLYSFFIAIIPITEYYSGIIVSLLCSIGLYIVSAKLFTLLGLTASQKAIALACLTFNYTLIYYSNRIFRYQLIALLGTSTIYFFLSHNPVAGGICWGLLGLTCVYAGLRGFWVWVLMSLNLYALIPFFLIFGSWFFDKWNVYKSHKYYPAGIDGKIEPMDKLTWKQLLSPLYFPWTYAYYGKRELGYDFKNWHKKIGGIFGLYQLPNKKLNLLVSLVTILFGIMTIRGMLQSPFPLVLLTLILLYPSLLKRFLPRNSIVAIPLICYFIGKGAWIMPNCLSNLLILSSGFAFLWFNRVFVFNQPKIKARVTSQYLDNLPKDGVLVEGLIAYPIAYRTRKRVVCIPHDPTREKARYQTDLSIKEFDLNYVVISNLWLTEIHLGYPAIEYIKSFKLLKTIREDNDIYYVYEIPFDITA